MTARSIEWTGSNLAAIRTWVNGLDIPIYLKNDDSQPSILKIEDQFHDIHQVSIGEYIVKHNNDITTSQHPRGAIHPELTCGTKEERVTATILAALRYMQATLDNDIDESLYIGEMSHFDEATILSDEEINSLCEEINCNDLILKNLNLSKI